MTRISIFTIFILLFVSTSSFAGYFKSSLDYRGSVSAAVEIDGKGIYNLLISVQFLRKPFDKGKYDSDQYEELINRLSVEWRGVALKTVLNSNKYKVSDLSSLMESVEMEIENLINQSKRKHGISEKTEVVYSVSNFLLIDTSDD